MKTRETLAEQYLEWIIDALSADGSGSFHAAQISQASPLSQGMIDGKIGATSPNDPAISTVNTVDNPVDTETVEAVINRIIDSINSLADSFEGAPISTESKKYILDQMTARANEIPKLAEHHKDRDSRVDARMATAALVVIDQIETQFQAMHGNLWY